MKKKLALVLAGIMCVTCLFTGCNSANPNGTGTESGKNTESGSGNSSTEKVDVSDLYEKGQFEGVDMSKYVTLGEYAGLLKIAESEYTVTDEEIQKKIDKFRDDAATTKEIKDRDIVQKGDVVTIDYVGRCSCGIKFEGGSAETYDLEIGSESFIPGFEDGLIGAKKGTKVDVKLTFPTDYHDADIAGKDVVFTVTINKISEKVLPEYNDEFVADLTDDVYTKAEEFTAYVEGELVREKKITVLNKFLKELEKKSTFTEEVTSMVTKQYDESLKSLEAYASMYGYTVEQFVLLNGYESLEEFKNEIASGIKNEILRYAYGNAVGLELEDKVVLDYANELVDAYGAENVVDIISYLEAAVVRSDAYIIALAEYVIANYK